MAAVTTAPRKWLPLMVVVATIALQLVAAYVLDVAAARTRALGIIALAAIGLAVALHGVRFVLWGYVHRRYPLSHTYPLTALFFPFVLLISHLRGDAVTAWQLAGTALITTGVGLMTLHGRARQDVE